MSGEYESHSYSSSDVSSRCTSHACLLCFTFPPRTWNCGWCSVRELDFERLTIEGQSLSFGLIWKSYTTIFTRIRFEQFLRISVSLISHEGLDIAEFCDLIYLRLPQNFPVSQTVGVSTSSIHNFENQNNKCAQFLSTSRYLLVLSPHQKSFTRL